MTNNNTLSELNNQLFASLRALNTELTGDALKEEIAKAKAVSDLGRVIVDNNKIALDAIKMVQDGKAYAANVKNLIGNNDNK